MIVVCGEALMDVFPGASTPRGLALDARVGGSPFNLAIGLARLGQPVAFFGALGRDIFGERLLRALQDEGVETGSSARVDAPTTLGLVGTDAHGVPAYTFYGAAGADRQLGLEALARLPQAIGAIHVGSYALVVDPVAATLRALVEREQARTLIACDPNVRLAVEPDPARWCASLRWMLARAHLLKISAEDLALLLPGVAPEAFAADALAQGVRLVVVTRGEHGAQGWVATGAVTVPAVAVPVVDTVGAGDAFQAALLAWLADNDHLSIGALAALPAAALREGLHYAVRAAAIACSRRGADLPRRAEL